MALTTVEEALLDCLGFPIEKERNVDSRYQKLIESCARSDTEWRSYREKRCKGKGRGIHFLPR